MTMPRTKKTAEETIGYGELRQQLDDVVGRLQDPDCDVDQAAALYEQVLQCIARLEAHLQAAEHRVEKVQAEFGDAAGQGGR